MIELLQEYGLAYLYSDGTGLSGLAMTLWLFLASMVLGFALSLPLALARTSRHAWLRLPVQLYTFVFRGTPLYIQLLICYTGDLTLRFNQQGCHSSFECCLANQRDLICS